MAFSASSWAFLSLGVRDSPWAPGSPPESPMSVGSCPVCSWDPRWSFSPAACNVVGGWVKNPGLSDGSQAVYPWGAREPRGPLTTHSPEHQIAQVGGKFHLNKGTVH